MQRRDFAYELPKELIAQAPLADRSASRLLQLDRHSGQLRDRLFLDLPRLLRPGDLLVVNNTKVIKARLHGTKSTGGKVEVLLDRLLCSDRALAFVRASKSPKPGATLGFSAGNCEVVERHEDLFELKFSRPIQQLLDDAGQVPLPPYIQRSPTREDEHRYQTLFAKRPGAVAAPTAALHFDQALLERLRDNQVWIASITLHVGAGTFAPLREEDVDAHELHAEHVEVGQETCAAIAQARQRGGRVIAVGTTSVRALEAAAQGTAAPQPFSGDTRLFIKPGFEFKVLDGLITNFHLPESTLIMLVAAFAGREAILRAYEHAVKARYRFFSYGDAMLLL